MRRQARFNIHGHSSTVGPRRAVLFGTLAAGALFLAGCGGTSPDAGVAHLATGTSARSSTAPGTAPSTGGGEASPGSQAVAYAACIRANGVPNFPDPQITTSANGVSVRQAVPAGVGIGNPKFKSAEQACRKLLPIGEGPSQRTVSPQEQAQYLKAAACIRSHGVPNFPDPTFSGGGAHINHQGLNLHSPSFLAAEQACKSLIPGGLHGGR